MRCLTRPPVRVLMFLVLFSLVATVAAPQERLPDGFVKIDGAKNPELFPEWFIWEGTLRMIRYPPQQEYLKRKVEFTEQEWKAIIAAGKEQTAREARLDVAIKPFFEGATREQIDKARRTTVHELEVDYRWEVLKAGEALQETLRPETAAAFRRWMDEMMARRVVLLSDDAYERFYVPK